MTGIGVHDAGIRVQHRSESTFSFGRNERSRSTGIRRYIKDLVIDTCMSEGAFPSYERLTTLVRQHFPTSKWQKTHYAWYKSKIKTGDIIVPGFPSPSESQALAADTVDADSEVSAEIEASVETSISLERDLHAYLATRVHEVEPGLTLVENGVEYQTAAGRVDLLAKDSASTLVVIELKAGKAKDDALGQLLGYMGCLCESKVLLEAF